MENMLKKHIFYIILIATGYFVAARLGLLLAFPGTNATPLWAPTGISLAAVLEGRVRERTEELEKKISEIERLNKLFVGRELRMKELKEKIKELESRTQ